MRSLPLAAALVAGLAVTACTPADNEPLKLDAATVSQAANARVAEHVAGLTTAVKSLERSDTLRELASSDDSQGCPPAQPGMPPPACEVATEPNPFDFTEPAEDVRKWLADKVFNAASVESSTETSVTYRVSSNVACPESTDENDVVSRDADCVKIFTELPVRLVVTSTSEGDLDIALQVGPHAPGKLELYREHLAVQADLAQAKATIEAVAALLEDELDALPDPFAGKLEVKLTRHDSDDYAAALSILEAVVFGMNDATSLEYVKLNLAPAAAAVSARISSKTGEVTAGIAFADLDVAAALDLVFGESESTDCTWNEQTQEEECTTTTPEAKVGVLTAAIGGLTGSGTFGLDDDVLELKGLGVGNEKATVKLDGTQLLGLTINPSAGGTFDLLAASLEDGGRVTVSPSLDVTVEHDLTSLAAALGEDSEVPAWLLGGSSSVAATGPKTVVRVFDAPEQAPCEGDVCPESESGKVQVEEGKVTLKATGITDVVVEASECLVEAESGEEESDEEEEGGDEAHPFSMFAGGACE